MHLRVGRYFALKNSVMEMDSQAAFWSELDSGMTGWRLLVKQSVDYLIALALFPLLALISVTIGIAIKLESKGPVFFEQVRVGKNGRRFSMVKFRSMYEGAEKIRIDVEHLNEVRGPAFKMRSDPRVTRLGSFLRRSSLDELPQLINVLRGDMSLVGPRPPLPHEVDRYNRHQLQRLAVKPGLTCLWQVNGRSNVSFDHWVEFDLEYIRKQSLWLDFKIVLKTIPAVLKGHGAW